MTSKYLFPALLSTLSLVALICVGDRAQTANEHPTAGQTALGLMRPDNRDAQSLIEAVSRTYSNLAHYKSKGVNKERSDFDGKVKDEEDIPFEIEYIPGEASVIKWTQNSHEKVFTVRGKESWLEIDGKRDETFSSPRDGLMRVSYADGGRSLFVIHLFVFRNELLLQDRFFLRLVKPEVSGEGVVDGHACYMLTGTYKGVESRDTYWIDKESSVIRRIERVITIRKQVEGKEYVYNTTSTENYSDIVLQADEKKPVERRNREDRAR